MTSGRVAGALCTALVVAACTGGSQAGPPPGGTTSATTAPPGTATGTGCDSSPAEPVADVALDPRWKTTLRLDSVEAFEQLASTGVGGNSVTKFSILDFFGDATVEWLDSDFYTLHDEWFWFRLLNGETFDSLDVAAVDGTDADTPAGGFATVADAYSWAEEHRDDLPLDLRFTSLDRLYSPQFYDLALDFPDTRPLALGSVIRVPASDDCVTPQRWLLELEYRDDPTAEQVERYLDIVGATLPSDVTDALLWVPRSREQELTADAMDAASRPNSRTIRFEDLATPGEVEVYSPGVAAGRLLLVTDDSRYSLSDAGPDDIVIVQRTPDYLPPGSALITGTPQTPLAHVNVLALNRGIPNAYLSGLVDNVELNQLGRVRAPVAIRVVGNAIDIRALTDEEFNAWRSRRGTAAIAVPELDLATLPLTIDLDEFNDALPTEPELAALRPIIGGKAAGFIGLAAPGTVTMPQRPLAITVRSYFEHIAALDAEITAMLQDPAFTQSSRVRFIVLEGADDFGEAFDSAEDQQFLDEFLEAQAGLQLGAIVAAGGFKEVIRDLDVDPATLDSIETALLQNFGDLSLTQGLRFRSSSSVEDIEGFNGAGLYSSNTGFIDPTVLDDPDDHGDTVERALKRTWSSYWNFEAVEERYAENVDQRSGGMAVLVHPRFDDELEISNGVATFTLLPPIRSGTETYAIEELAVMHVNVQAGDTSVTNPDNEPGQAPEVVVVRLAVGDEQPRIERIAASTLVAGGADVLTDEQLLTTWQQMRDVTESWRNRVNAELPTSRQISTLTLDFEFREMAAEWPARSDGSEAPTSRIVIKQARTLEPGLRGLPDTLTSLDVPRDVLARVARADEITCPAAATDDSDVFFELFTDPLATVDMGYSVAPLLVAASGSSTRIIDSTCRRASLFSSANDYLLGLFALEAD